MKNCGVKRMDLCGEWKLSYKDRYSSDCGEITAVVPSNIELDFIRAGLLPKDIFFGENIRLAEKYETYDFTYSRVFDCADTSRDYRLAFLGVDTSAEYFLNGERIGESDNMLVEHVFNVGKLKEKDNELVVKIRSSALACNDGEFTLRMLAGNWGSETPEASVLRRAAHTYGWDIMPRAISAGIWRGVYLEEIPRYEFKQFYVATDKITGGAAHIFAAFELSAPYPIKYGDGYRVVVNGKCGDSEFFAEKDLRFRADKIEFTIDSAKLWNPVGFGEPNLYEVTATLIRGGESLCTCKTNLGVRTAELVRTDVTDGENGKFAFVINGNEIFCRGTNWVPLSPYHSADAARLPLVLSALKDSGYNMVRMWGGNVYESDEFFDFADRHGILVWQDFSFGCTFYPNDEKFLNKVKAEAKKVIERLRNHPSIVLWAGDNEGDIMAAGKRIDPETDFVTRRALPEAVAEFDRFRPYLPSSPYVSKAAYENGGVRSLPEQHLWGARDWFKSNYYANAKAHFVSEIGYPACPSVKSLKKFIDESKLNDRRDGHWILHSTSVFGNPYRLEWIEKHVKTLFGYLPDDIEEFALLSQFSQSEAMKFFMENARKDKPRKSGVLLWNLADGWPQITEATVDYYMERKLAFDVIARSVQPFAMMCVENVNGRVCLFAVNDTNKSVGVQYSVTDVDTGETVACGEVTVPENGRVNLGILTDILFEKRMLILSWQGDMSGFNHYITGRPEYNPDDFKRWYEKLRVASNRK